MNKYEAVVIFSETLKEASLDEAVGRVKAEVKKLGGDVDSTTRLGKRSFARKLKKKESGHYVLMTFRLAADQVRPLQARLKLNEEVFRIQVVVAPKRAAKPARPEKEEEAVAHGVS